MSSSASSSLWVSLRAGDLCFPFFEALLGEFLALGLSVGDGDSKPIFVGLRGNVSERERVRFVFVEGLPLAVHHHERHRDKQSHE